MSTRNKGNGKKEKNNEEGCMKKPEKKRIVYADTISIDGYKKGYNQACDDWEKYCKEVFKTMQEELHRLRTNLHKRITQ